MSIKPDTTHSDYSQNAAAWKRCRDFVAGSDQVKAQGENYLPKLTGQPAAEYSAYKNRTVFFNGSSRTVEGFSGMVMRVEPQVELPKALEELLDDADYQGTSLYEFAGSQVTDVLTVGRSGILVDMPSSGAEIITQAQAIAQGLRPYLAHYPAETILNWKQDRVNGKTVTTRVVLKESYTVGTDDEFVDQKLVQIRVLDFDEAGYYRQRLFRRNGKGEWEQFGEDIYPLKNRKKMALIPFVFLGPESTTPAVQKSPILDMVNVNLGHYQLSADYYNALHFTGLPTPVITGQKIPENDSIALGSESFLVLSNQGANAFFLEFEGRGIGAVETEIKNLEQRMAVLGARMLMEDKKMAEAAETAAIHRSGEAGVLAGVAGAVSKGIKSALQLAAEWVNATEEITFTLNKDFMPTTMNAQLLQQLTASWQSGGISHQVYFEALKRGEIIRADLDLEEMKEDIDQDIPGGNAGLDD